MNLFKHRQQIGFVSYSLPTVWLDSYINCVVVKGDNGYYIYSL